MLDILGPLPCIAASSIYGDFLETKKEVLEVWRASGLIRNYVIRMKG